MGLFSLGDQHHLSINPHAYPTGFLAIVYGVTIGSYITEGERRNSLSHLQACQNNFIFRFLAQIQLFENLLTCIPTNES